MNRHPYNNTNHCPFCGSVEITDYDFDIIGDTLLMNKQCDDCDEQWDNVYKLQGYEKVN